MQPRDFVLMAHGAFDGGINGRTRLQKIVYFLSVLLKEDLGYKPHYYGPYSPIVAEANAELKELGFINETSTVYGFNNQGFEMTQYSYYLTEDGKKLLERKKEKYSDKWKDISKIAKKIESAGPMHYMELAMAAKTYLILQRGDGQTNKETIKAKAKQLGWSIDDSHIDNALRFLEEIGLSSWGFNHPSA